MTQAAQPAKKAAKKAAVPPLDLSVLKGLAVTAAPAPARQQAVAAQDNPALAWVRESWSKKTAEANGTGGTRYVGAGQQVIVPTPNAGQVESLIRKAAIALSRELSTDEKPVRIGVAIRRNDSPKDSNGRRLAGQSAIQFAAITGKDPYTRKATKAAQAAAPAAPADGTATN